MAEQADFLDSGGREDRASTDPLLVVDVDGFEGPLDLLLTLARGQKVDLTRISILALVEQYLAFVAEARRLRLELAADYLVMAAWLAYLKSRLLIPEQKDEDEPTGEELAAALAFRLQRLEAMRTAAARLMDRSRLGRDIFARGAPETTSVTRTSVWEATIYDLLTAYAAQRQRQSVTSVRVRRRTVWSLQEARELLTRLVGSIAEWTPITGFLKDYLADEADRATVIASTFSASLEMVREGQIEVRQSEPFSPVYVRRRPSGDSDGR
ncbi:segregation and condensation protein A [Polymorphum gilvum]|uniref:Segregation and condensation protein A n=1 Tax=Polymorphum gilvum (strain LMG 25793 / CGMCC 1.9160 / SL003B-26A1) TaxID=991905 RepID=F2IZ02_POLGS|nr:ScpA family protein [Polymorphum gilvum]ADZ70617.1 Segregation and condensation protein A [Polymorphum gilvum SL003B-26A1]